ncbi:murein DD-endopeptidase MepM/ murein hydrolase activator NlpD [Agrococcus sp. UYP10]|uniref:peptidoglycan DD-metalloendopeptidase family protein n=1 Tax=Agrococcus sp. UYP10 TaxID=1756355 RepID=UPI0033955E59
MTIARTAAEARAELGVAVVQGSPLIYTSRRAMRVAATRTAQALPARVAELEPAARRIVVDAPALGNGGEHAPSQRRAPVAAVPLERSAPSSRSPAGRRHRRGVARQVTAGAALLLIGSLVVVTSLPAQAVQPPAGLDPRVAQLEPEVQSLAPVSSEATTLFARDAIVVSDPVESALMSPDELAALQATADSEAGGSYFGGDPAFPGVWPALETDYVQTPFPQIADMPISSGFGNRPGGFHGGTDIPLPPGQEIRPIANGVVSAVWQGDNPGGGGYAVFVDHNIDGRFVQSWYPHMLAGSIRVEVGQVVDISTVLGGVGSTGRSSGPHLHLELKNSDYVSFDPVTWLETRELRLETG